MTGRVFVPVLERVCGITVNGTVHAVAMTPRFNRRKTVDTVCGHQRARLLTVEAINPDGDQIGVSAMAWPPPAREHVRCADCLAATGARRPHPSWAQLRNPTETDR